MDILYQRGRATGAEIHEALPDAPTYSAVRAKLRVLEEKGHVRHEEEALRYVYLPTVARDIGAQIGAAPHGVHFFCGQRGRNGGGAAGSFGGQSGARGSGANFPNDRDGEETRRRTMTWADFVVRGHAGAGGWICGVVRFRAGVCGGTAFDLDGRICGAAGSAGGVAAGAEGGGCGTGRRRPRAASGGARVPQPGFARVGSCGSSGAARMRAGPIRAGRIWLACTSADY